MTEEVKNVHREPHPFVAPSNLLNFVGRTVAFVGTVQKTDKEQSTLLMNTFGGTEVRILRFKAS